MAIGAGLIALMVAAGCNDIYTNGAAYRASLEAAAGPQDVDLAALSYRATERLLQAAQQPLDKDRPVLVASLVDIADLEQSSDLGRIVAEQISSRLTQLGYRTKELKFRHSFLIRQGAGEFVLSRDLEEIADKQQAQAVVAGVYAVAKNAVYVTLKLIRAADGTPISSVDYRLAMGPDLAALLDPYDGFEY